MSDQSEGDLRACSGESSTETGVKPVSVHSSISTFVEIVMAMVLVYIIFYVL